MLNEEEETELRKIIAERNKWICFFEILRRPYVFIPTTVIFVALVDDPNFYIVKAIMKYFVGSFNFINGH